MGRHHESDQAGRRFFLPLALVGVLAAGGLTWVAVGQGIGDGTDPSGGTAQVADDEAFASAMAAHEGHGGQTSEAAAATETVTEEALVTEEADEETEEPVAEGVPDGLAACADSVSAAETTAEAAAISAEHWRVHYTAQLKIDSGEYTFERAGKDWANKKYGPEDVKRFDDAKEAYDKVSGDCADLDIDALDAEHADAATACVDRSTLLADVVKTGAVVNKDWGDHVDQMAVKSETPPDEYYDWWIREVKEAPGLMKPYDEAVEAFEEAPACEVG